MRESGIANHILLALGSESDLVLMRNPSGVAKYPGGGVVPYGVGINHRGGSDLIGILRAGDGRGIFLAPEIKSATGRQRDEQKNFERVVTSLGGEYALLRSPADALAWLAELRRKHG